MENLCYFVCSRGLLKSCKYRATMVESSSSRYHAYLETFVGGGSVYVCTELLKYFASVILPRITSPFILVSGDSDVTVPDEILHDYELKRLLDSPFLIRWYAQNMVIQEDEKIVQMPIGLDYHTISKNPSYSWRKEGEGFLPRHQEGILHSIRAEMRPFWERLAKIYVNFSLHTDRFGQRENSLKEIPAELVEKNMSFIKRTDGWKNTTNYAFVLSPFGNGMDCHRTWEALCLGAIPIVKAPQFALLFEGLPVLNVTEWSDITQELLDKTVAEFREKEFQYDKLTLAYWKERISTI